MLREVLVAILARAVVDEFAAAFKGADADARSSATEAARSGRSVVRAISSRNGTFAVVVGATWP